MARVESAGTIFEIKYALNGVSTSPSNDDGVSKSLQIKVKTDEDLYEWIDFIYARCPGMRGVSNPTSSADQGKEIMNLQELIDQREDLEAL